MGRTGAWPCVIRTVIAETIINVSRVRDLMLFAPLSLERKNDKVAHDLVDGSNRNRLRKPAYGTHRKGRRGPDRHSYGKNGLGTGTAAGPAPCSSNDPPLYS